MRRNSVVPLGDDRIEPCLDFLAGRMVEHRRIYAKAGTVPPLFVGLNGVQGAGKSTLVSALATKLSSAPYYLLPCVFSIDDIYLDRRSQNALASSQRYNPLVQHRGEPGTHDVALGRRLFTGLRERHEVIRIPSYDKTAFDGHGDRRPESSWRTVAGKQVDIVIFEGWCVGFRALEDAQVEARWKEELYYKHPTSQLWRHKLENLLWVNNKLRDYDVLTNMLDAFIYLDVWDLQYVYKWRQQAEAEQRERSGSGMTDEEVKNFVDGYYPAYELYRETLRKNIWNGPEQSQRSNHNRFLGFVVNTNRRVVSVSEF